MNYPGNHVSSGVPGGLPGTIPSGAPFGHTLSETEHLHAFKELGQAVLGAFAPSPQTSAPRLPPGFERHAVSIALTWIGSWKMDVSWVAYGCSVGCISGVWGADCPPKPGCPFWEVARRVLSTPKGFEVTKALAFDKQLVAASRAMLRRCAATVGDSLSWRTVQGLFDTDPEIHAAANEVIRAVYATVTPYLSQPAPSPQAEAPEVVQRSAPATMPPLDVPLALVIVEKLAGAGYVKQSGLNLSVPHSHPNLAAKPSAIAAARVFLRACFAVSPPEGRGGTKVFSSEWWRILRWGFETGQALEALAQAFLRAAVEEPRESPAPSAERRRGRRVPMAASSWRAIQARGATVSPLEIEVPAYGAPVDEHEPLRRQRSLPSGFAMHREAG